MKFPNYNTIEGDDEKYVVTLRAQGGAASSDARQPAFASQHGFSASTKNSLDLTALLTYVTHGMLGFFFLN